MKVDRPMASLTDMPLKRVKNANIQSNVFSVY